MTGAFLPRSHYPAFGSGGSCPLPGLILNGIIVTYGLLQETGKAFFHP